jgi:plasmid stabilization system protein ParE
MRLRWSPAALADLERFYLFLSPVNQNAAKRSIAAIRAGARKTLEHPRLGERVEEATGREVRKLFIDRYELRYEVPADEIRVLRICHMREQR